MPVTARSQWLLTAFAKVFRRVICSEEAGRGLTFKLRFAETSSSVSTRGTDELSRNYLAAARGLEHLREDSSKRSRVVHTEATITWGRQRESNNILMESLIALIKLGMPANVTALMVQEFMQTWQRLDVGLDFAGVEHNWSDVKGPARKMSAYLRAFLLRHRIHRLLQPVGNRVDCYGCGVFVHPRL
jgi:hypothetical protein